MSDVAAFVRDRLDEDEREARVCLGGGGSPTRWYKVLAQVAAMRAIVDDYESLIGDRSLDHEFDPQVWGEVGAFDTTLRHLAAIWTDHEAYDPAWAPDA